MSTPKHIKPSNMFRGERKGRKERGGREGGDAKSQYPSKFSKLEDTFKLDICLSSKLNY
jgi:hypothetical protein